jgi:hypothetical protein
MKEELVSAIVSAVHMYMQEMEEPEELGDVSPTDQVGDANEVKKPESTTG